MACSGAAPSARTARSEVTPVRRADLVAAGGAGARVSVASGSDLACVTEPGAAASAFAREAFSARREGLTGSPRSSARNSASSWAARVCGDACDAAGMTASAPRSSLGGTCRLATSSLRAGAPALLRARAASLRTAPPPGITSGYSPAAAAPASARARGCSAAFEVDAFASFGAAACVSGTGCGRVT